MDSLPPGMPASLILPRIEAVPGVVLEDFVTRRARRWGGAPVEVPGALTVALFAVLAASLGVGGWLVAVLAGGAPCSGLPCNVATWGKPVFHLVLAAVAVLCLSGTALATRGLTEVGPASLASALLGAVCGLVAVSGVIALLVLAALARMVAAGVFAAAVDRF